ncbi:gluconeogenesis factor YvcK family protein [Corynebacterium xerosis]|uniref:Putative gluconeogenesis factor n=1 Tax=Corynebacterium xerosis TaxID=1725 RepID=A0A7X9SU85_9CORY|nr:uridine diphosphate-N-acetylglucosamine-binding protein YvcK [Corynebacterium xerosis]NMF08167.1 uridine diphosphate-N-acetylglucosamine-binding protein YvcK [Corynebacterium xerosis]SQB95129.1 transporter [Clostridium paraputrificum]HJG57218.1 uridine diphosphate-N-acetylglucosamine-binding protein YvcK [Corynebacterium xerosis]
MTAITSLGGGHGLFATLRAVRRIADEVTAVVTVADDGGSSGRLRRELGRIPPGDLRMALAALSADDERGRLWEDVLQHRFGGTGALAGHAVGNLIIAGLTSVLDDEVRALDEIGSLLGICGRVLPMSPRPLDIEAEVVGLEDDARVVRPVRGQVAVATTPGQVRRIRLIPDNPPATPDAVEAIMSADMVTLGPGSWFTSVLPHLQVPELVGALRDTSAQRVVVLNLSSEPGETAGFSSERHVHMLTQHAPDLTLDKILVDESTIGGASERSYLERAAATLSAEVVYADVREIDAEGGWTERHDPVKVAAALGELLPR